MKKKKIIYIAGLGHSGTTILDMILGVNDKIIGLGEIMAFVKRKDKATDLKSTCSCGQTGYNCDFWQHAEEKTKNETNNNKAYLNLLDYFYEKYGDETILVDSSKNSYNYLEILNQKYDLQIIYLTKDFRNWAYSSHLRTNKNIFLNMLHWFLENVKLLHKLKSMNLKYIKLGYEEFALYPDFSLQKICDLLSIDFDEKMLFPGNTKSHIIAGNVVRADKEKRSKIIYDAKWITSTKVNLISILFLPFFRFNKKLVYSNLLGKKLNPLDFAVFNPKKRKETEKRYN